MKKVFFHQMERPRNVVVFEWLWVVSVFFMLAWVLWLMFVDGIYQSPVFEKIGLASFLLIVLFGISLSILILLAITIYRFRIFYITIVLLYILHFIFWIYLELKVWNFDAWLLFYVISAYEFYLLMSKKFRVWVFDGQILEYDSEVNR